MGANNRSVCASARGGSIQCSSRRGVGGWCDPDTAKSPCPIKAFGGVHRHDVDRARAAAENSKTVRSAISVNDSRPACSGSSCTASASIKSSSIAAVRVRRDRRSALPGAASSAHALPQRQSALSPAIAGSAPARRISSLLAGCGLAGPRASRLPGLRDRNSRSRQRQAAPGRTQQRQPRGAIGTMQHAASSADRSRTTGALTETRSRSTPRTFKPAAHNR